MSQKFETYAYNFNPRESPKDLKVKYLIRQGVMHRIDIPAGTINENIKYSTACKDAYISYNQCLESNKFDRQICHPSEAQVIQC